MKFCTKCGKEVSDEAVICLNCGCHVDGRPAHNGYYACLKTNRNLFVSILLSIVTLGIYSIVEMSTIGTDLNKIAGKYDGKNTMHFCLMAFILSWLTFGIYPLVWYHCLSERIGNELRRRGIAYSFGAGTYWGWSIFGSLLFGIGPFVYMHKLLTSMNFLSENYNVNG